MPNFFLALANIFGVAQRVTSARISPRVSTTMPEGSIYHELRMRVVGAFRDGGNSSLQITMSNSRFKVQNSAKAEGGKGVNH